MTIDQHDIDNWKELAEQAAAQPGYTWFADAIQQLLDERAVEHETLFRKGTYEYEYALMPKDALAKLAAKMRKLLWKDAEAWHQKDPNGDHTGSFGPHDDVCSCDEPYDYDDGECDACWECNERYIGVLW